MPIWLRSGGIVPLLDAAVQTLAPDTSPDVVSAADRAGILDVRVAIDAKTGVAEARMVDGTSFYVEYAGGALALPTTIGAVTTTRFRSTSERAAQSPVGRTTPT